MCDVRHSVRRAIIDDDDLQTAAIGEGLLGQSADTGPQRLGFVVSSQDHAYGQIGVGGLSWAFRQGCDAGGKSSDYIARKFEQRRVPEQDHEADEIERTQKRHGIHRNHPPSKSAEARSPSAVVTAISNGAATTTATSFLTRSNTF